MAQKPNNLNNINLAFLKFVEIQFTDVNNVNVVFVKKKGLNGHEIYVSNLKKRGSAYRYSKIFLIF